MNPLSSIRQAPVTVCLIWVACSLFVGVALDTTNSAGSRLKALSKWGAGLPLMTYWSESESAPSEPVPGSTGPIQVWEGQWWRLLVNNLHHGGLIHLFVNGCAMIFLGRIIERRMSPLMYVLLLVGAAFSVAAVSGLTSELGIGLSGVAYAQVGLLMAWRDRDESVAEEFTFRMVVFAGCWLFICQVLTYTGILSIANAAHYTGLIYGWIWGQVYLEVRQRGIFRFLFGVSHLLLIPAFWFIVHPFWLGSWHWYLSQELDLMKGELQLARMAVTEAERGEIDRKLAWLDEELRTERRQKLKIERLQTALLLEPSLEHGWIEISRIYERSGKRRLALRTVLEGLKHNRNSERLLNRTTDLWMDDELRTNNSNVSRIVQQVFGPEADVWEKKLSDRVLEKNRLAWQPESLSRLLGLPELFSLARVLRQSIDQGLVPAPEPSGIPAQNPPSDLPEFDPFQLDSAREGGLF